MPKRGQGEGTISKLKNGTYCGRLTVGYDDAGKQRRRAFYGKTKKEVQIKMNTAKVALDNDNYVEPCNKTVSAWLDEWLQNYKKRSVRVSTYSNLCNYSRLYIKPALGDVKLKDLNVNMVQEFINCLVDKGFKRNYLLSIKRCLHGALEQAVTNGLVYSNVAEKVIIPKEDKEDMVVMSSEEQERFINIAKKYHFGDLYILMLGTGLRIGEATALTWSDIDFDTSVLSVNKTNSFYYSGEDNHCHCLVNPPKTKSGIRTIPLIPELLSLLAQRKARNIINADLIFAEDDGRMASRITFRNRFKMILKEAGIDDNIHLHTLRHTFATRGLENGIELIVMKELLGHANISMTADIYTHVTSDKKMDSIMKLEDSFPLHKQKRL